MRRQIYWAVCGIAVLAAWGAVLGFGGPGTEPEDKAAREGFGMFSWDEGVLEPEETQTLSDVAKKADVTTIYQQFSRECLEGRNAGILLWRWRRRGLRC